MTAPAKGPLDVEWFVCADCGKRFRIGCPGIRPHRCLDCLLVLDASHPPDAARLRQEESNG